MPTRIYIDSSVSRALSGLDEEDLRRELKEIMEQQEGLEAHRRLVQTALQWKTTLGASDANGGAHVDAAEITSRTEVSDNGSHSYSEEATVTNRTSVPTRRRSPGVPSLRVAILTVLAERPSAIWTKDELIERLDELGWLPSGGTARNQVTSRLGELKKRGQVIKHGDGEYSLGAEGTPQGNLLGAGETAE